MSKVVTTVRDQLLEKLTEQLRENGLVIYVPEAARKGYAAGQLSFKATWRQHELHSEHDLAWFINRLIWSPSWPWSLITPRLQNTFDANDMHNLVRLTGFDCSQEHRFISLSEGAVAEMIQFQVALEGRNAGTPIDRLPHKIPVDPDTGLTGYEKFAGEVWVCTRFILAEEVRRVRRCVEDYLRKSEPVVPVRAAAWLNLISRV